MDFFRIIPTMNSRGISVAIVGCGWLGIPLAKNVIDKGYQVKGTTTRSEKLDTLNALGIEAYQLKFPDVHEVNDALFDVDFLVLNIPPGRRDPDVLKNYEKSIKKIVDKAKESVKIKKIIFISSTSVYGSNIVIIDEETEAIPSTASGNTILKAEQHIVKSGLPYVILRFGGLAGPDRHPGRFLAGKIGLSSGEQSVNFLHLTDAIGVIKHMMEQEIEGEIFNVVAPVHPKKEAFYTAMANSINLSPPLFESASNEAKREVAVDKLLKETNFRFVFEDPMNFKF